jgi:hypothetical protein
LLVRRVAAVTVVAVSRKVRRFMAGILMMTWPPGRR